MHVLPQTRCQKEVVPSESIGTASGRQSMFQTPGDQLLMKVETTRGKPGGKVWKFKGVATVDGEMAAEAEFTAMMDLQG